MTDDQPVFRMGASIEDDRPEIPFDAPEHSGLDWGPLDEVLSDAAPVDAYKELYFHVPHPDAAKWGMYAVAGTSGLISQDAVEVIGRQSLRLFELLPARINNAVYYFLKPRERLACLDLSMSDVVRFKMPPYRVMEIRKFHFNKAAIPDSIVFSIPELPDEFVTGAVRDAIMASRIPGFRFQRVA
jgi:hypothetical protein